MLEMVENMANESIKKKKEKQLNINLIKSDCI